MKILDDFTIHLKAMGNYAPNYISVMKRFITYTNEHSKRYDNIEQLDFLFFEKFLLFLAEHENKKETTLNAYLAALRAFYRFMVCKDLKYQKTLDELYKIKAKKEPTRKRVYLKEEEFKDIVEMVITFITKLSILKVRTVLYFMFYTGLRCSEVVELKREDIDLKLREVLVRTPNKGKVEKIVFFTKKVQTLLEEYFYCEREDKNAFNLTRSMLRRMVENMNDYSKKRVTPHILRHSFAMNLADKHIDIKAAQILLGHKDIKTTQIYYEPELTTIKEIYDEKVDKKGKK